MVPDNSSFWWPRPSFLTESVMFSFATFSRAKLWTGSCCFIHRVLEYAFSRFCFRLICLREQISHYMRSLPMLVHTSCELFVASLVNSSAPKIEICREKLSFRLFRFRPALISLEKRRRCMYFDRFSYRVTFLKQMSYLIIAELSLPSAQHKASSPSNYLDCFERRWRKTNTAGFEPRRKIKLAPQAI